MFPCHQCLTEATSPVTRQWQLCCDGWSRAQLRAVCPQPEIITAHGYPVEVHYVLTQDGYLLEMHRIPGGRGQQGHTPGRPVLALHGVQDSSAAWVINPKQSLGQSLSHC